ncbi:MAG: cysteine--tRNA ligase [Myxococcales bacterium]|nr:cysteine--tRNA ligase [Myxococcales bacterium]
MSDSSAPSTPSAPPTLVVYDTAARRKRAFEPLEPGRVRMYSCGPTVYAPQHVGNMRPYVFADVLKRTLRMLGYAVTHVVNITDVGHLTDDADAGEDKMEVAARKAGLRAADIAARYTEEWQRDVERLHCLPPDVLCRASEHIPEQIELALALERGGYTYRLEDGLYFDTSKFERYAAFARLDLSGQEAGARIGEVAGKRNPADFALWKFAEPGVARQQEWESPWGRGFPGWHLECSAMSTKYLGRQFDIHTGGEDHVPVHHTNEIAQSECALGVHPWVRYWMHNAFLDFGGEKMSKSKGHVLVLQTLVDEGIEPLAYRMFLLQAVYRMPQSFKREAIRAAQKSWQRLRAAAAATLGAAGEGDPAARDAYRAEFRAALCDDLNTPRALAVAFEVARSGALADVDKRALLLEFDEVLGLGLAEARPESEAGESDPRIDALLEERRAARASRDFATADRIRDELAAEGVEIVDGPDGSRWRRR